MIGRGSIFALIAVFVGAFGCARTGQSVSVTEASSGAELSRSESPSGDDDLFVSLTVGVSLRKPSSWHFMPTTWRVENLKRVDFKDEGFADLAAKYATQPLVIVSKYEETMDTLNPTFQTVFRPLPLEDMSPEDVAQLALQAMPQIYEDFEIVEDVEPTEVGGHEAVHYAVKFTLRNHAGAVFTTLSETWIVKRGAYIFMLGGSGPPDGDDASRSEFAAMVRSIVIEPIPH